MRVIRTAHRVAIATALTATAALALSACTAPNESVSGSGEEAAGGELKTVHFVNPLPNYPTWRHIGDCMADAAEEAGLELTEAGPTGSSLDTTFMIERIQQAIANDVDAIITFPSNGELFGPVLQQARDGGVLVATTMGSADGAENVQVGVDWYDWGAMVADAVAGFGEDQRVGILTTDPTPPSSDFAEGFKARATEIGTVEVVDERYTDGDVTKFASLTAAMLTAHPDLTFIVSPEGAGIQGTSTAIREAGKTGVVGHLPYGLDNGGTEGIRDGSVSASTVFNLCELGRLPIESLVKISEGETLDPLVPIPLDIATKENIDEILSSGEWG